MPSGRSYRSQPGTDGPTHVTVAEIQTLDPVAQEREPYLKSLLDKFADTFFDGIERQVCVDTFGGHQHLGSLPNIGCHDVHYTDTRADPAVCLNGNLTLVAHDAPDQFAGGTRVQTGFVRDQNSSCDRFMRLLLHGQTSIILPQKN